MRISALKDYCVGPPPPRNPFMRPNRRPNTALHTGARRARAAQTTRSTGEERPGAKDLDCVFAQKRSANCGLYVISHLDGNTRLQRAASVDPIASVWNRAASQLQRYPRRSG